MFKRRFYEQAMKCFEHSGDELLQCRSDAYKKAEEASKKSGESEGLTFKMVGIQKSGSK